jgi:hypothetical protein
MIGAHHAAADQADPQGHARSPSISRPTLKVRHRP